MDECAHPRVVRRGRRPVVSDQWPVTGGVVELEVSWRVLELEGEMSD
jgi:hypothetical protein